MSDDPVQVIENIETHLACDDTRHLLQQAVSRMKSLLCRLEESERQWKRFRGQREQARAERDAAHALLQDLVENDELRWSDVTDLRARAVALLEGE
jgi:hypothetical protein